jgi:hypothetical protein
MVPPAQYPPQGSAGEYVPLRMEALDDGCQWGVIGFADAAFQSR